MSLEGRLRRLEAGTDPLAAVNAWLGDALQYESEDAYLRACLLVDPPFRPDRWILDGLADRRRGSRNQRASWREAREDALVGYTLSLDLLRDGDVEFSVRYYPLRLFTTQLDPGFVRGKRGADREDAVEAQRVARACAPTLLHEIDLQDKARGVLARQYFRDRDVRFASARQLAPSTQILVKLASQYLEDTEAGDRDPIAASSQEVDAAVARRLLLARAQVAVELSGPDGAVPLFRDLLAGPDRSEGSPN